MEIPVLANMGSGKEWKAQYEKGYVNCILDITSL